jgi:uncharacterized protein (UPF0305 family)
MFVHFRRSKIAAQRREMQYPGRETVIMKTWEYYCRIKEQSLTVSLMMAKI